MIPSARWDAVTLGPATRYTISATIDMSGPTVRGAQTVTVTNAEESALADLYFGLYPNAPFNGARLDVANVTAGGQTGSVSLRESGTALGIILPAPLQPGESISVHMDFTTTVPRSVPEGYAPIIYAVTLLALASWYPVLLVHDGQGWHTELGPEYGDLVYSASSLYTVDITAPSDLVLVASGIPYGEAQSDNGVRRWTYRTGPVRDFYIIASATFCVSSQQVGETVINSYYLAGRQAVGQRALDAAVTTMRALNERVGVYPFREFDVAESPIRAGGVEYPGVVVIGAFYYMSRPGADLDFVVAHETAHQWWYSVVGNDVIREPWLDEALTNYSASLYWEEAYGRARSEDLASQYFLAPYEQQIEEGVDLRVDQPVSAYGSAELYSAIVYGKGAMFFVSLRQAVGDDAFFRILRTYYSTYKYRIAHGADFMRIAAEIGGAAAQQTYDQWIGGVRK